MTILDRFNKQPNDNKKYQIDYSQFLATGETLTMVTTSVEILNEQPGDVGEPTLTIGTNQIVGDIFEYFVSSGTDNRRYKVTFLATTSDTQQVESEIEFKVVDT